MDTRTDHRTEIFTSLRPLLFSIAYRMLGSAADAEDVVQDAYLRWQDAPDVEIRDPRAYLATIVTRLSINQLHSARSQRETYVGPWLPEPLVSEHAPDPSEPIELAESLSMAFLVMLERLSPHERAVLLLRDVFDFEYAEISRIVGKSEANCRQLLVRAKKHLGSDVPRFDVDRAQADRLIQRFTKAADSGEIEGIVAMLAEDITLWADGGGKARSALHPIHGADAVARFVAGILQRFVPADRVMRPAEINGQPGLIAYGNRELLGALSFQIESGRIHTIYVITNPDKLRSVAQRI
jgi:RNA polymerase sigma-70 factor (ECF subfamily)